LSHCHSKVLKPVPVCGCVVQDASTCTVPLQPTSGEGVRSKHGWKSRSQIFTVVVEVAVLPVESVPSSLISTGVLRWGIESSTPSQGAVPVRPMAGRAVAVGMYHLGVKASARQSRWGSPISPARGRPSPSMTSYGPWALAVGARAGWGFTTMFLIE